MPKYTSRIFVISAPSGTGKTTLAKKLGRNIPDIKIIVTCTTRKPRPGEKNGIDYRFISRKTFQKMIDKGGFLEWAEVYDNLYGTPAQDVLDGIAEGKKVLLTVDTQGGLAIKRQYPDALLIGILPPSYEEQENRIRKRAGLSEEEIRERLKEAIHERRVITGKYDVQVINRHLDRTMETLSEIITGRNEQWK